jgi:hypothetical protein
MNTTAIINIAKSIQSLTNRISVTGCENMARVVSIYNMAQAIIEETGKEDNDG